MNYKGTNLQLQPGDIILDRSEFIPTVPMRYLAASIRFFTQFHYNHARIVIKLSSGRLAFLEARSIATVTLAEKSFERKKTKIAILRPKWQINQTRFHNEAEEFMGMGYDVPALPQLALYLTSAWFCKAWYKITKKKLYPKWFGKTGNASKDKVECIELVAHLSRMNTPWLLTAKDLFNSPLFDVIYDEVKNGVIGGTK